MRKPKDRDFLLTVDGLLFCVVDYLHPPDKITGYLKYAPATDGRWRRGDVSYDRVLVRYDLGSVRDTLQFLKHSFPQYIHHCPVRDMVFSMVPLDRIAEYYAPELRLAEIVAMPRDSLEEEAAALASELAQAAGIPVGALGVTGSILPGIHNPLFSDIDLTVYGADHAWRVRHFLRALKHGTVLTRPGLSIRPLNPEEVDDRRTGVLAIHPTLAPGAAEYLASRRWNFMKFEDRYFSVHATRTDDEIVETYGDHIYRDQGIARVVARVVDVSEALFSPAVYRLDRVQVREGEAAGIREVVSFDRIFADAVDEDTEVEIWGKVEQVGSSHQRLVVGSAALPDGGYLIPRAG